MTRTQKWIVGIFVALYVLTSGISTIHSVDFFRLANPNWLAITMAIAFEVGAAACLAAIVILDRTTRWMVWSLFALVTAVQVVGNMYFAYSHLADYRQWSELFGLVDQEPMLQKRVISIIAGGILPLVALGFIKSLVDLIRPAPNVSDVPELVASELASETTEEAVPLVPVMDPVPAVVSEVVPEVVPDPPIEPNTYRQDGMTEEELLARIRKGSV